MRGIPLMTNRRERERERARERERERASERQSQVFSLINNIPHILNQSNI